MVSKLCYSLIAIVLNNICSISSTRPNIVLMLADDMGWHDVGFHGSNEIPTPNIDALAYNGIILQRHYTLPTCTPSRAALLTGKYPIHNGMQGYPLRAGEPRGLPLTEKILPEYFQELGYATHLVGKWHLGFMHNNYTPERRGFDTHYGYWNGYIDYFNYTYDQKVNFGEPEVLLGYDLHQGLQPEYVANKEYATDLFTTKAVNIIRTHNTSKPLFLFISHLAVHAASDNDPLQVPDETVADNHFYYITDPERRRYAEMVHQLDKSVGEVISALQANDILSNTILIFLSDNGANAEGLHYNRGSNWPLRGMKFSVFEGGTRGVAALWWSGLSNPGRISNQLMHLTDWLPTLYVAAGGDMNNLGQIDGLNQWEGLVFQKKSPRTELLINIDEVSNSKAIIHGKWKLVSQNYGGGLYDGYWGDSGTSENNPTYNIDEVLQSFTAQALSTVKNLTEKETIEILREEAIIKCNFDALIENTVRYKNYSGNPPCSSFCLFNIDIDPCEINNLASVDTDIVESLKLEIDEYELSLVPQINTPIDPSSNPKYFNGVWTPWMDIPYGKYASNNANHLSFTYFYFLLISIFRLFHNCCRK